MGERKKSRFPVPSDHDKRVYAAFMGHDPIVAPPEPAAKDPWCAWTARLTIYCKRHWERLCRAYQQANISPALRQRVGPLLVQAQQRWIEAGRRLLSKAAPRRAGLDTAITHPDQLRSLGHRGRIRAPMAHGHSLKR
jgi:hypothetical protein